MIKISTPRKILFFSLTCITLLSTAAVQSAIPGIDGTWYVTVGGERRILSVGEEATTGWIAPEHDGNSSPIDSIEWDAESATLSFREVVPGAWQWYRLRIVDGVLKGRKSPAAALPDMPASEAFVTHVTGWNSAIFDSELTPRVFDAVLNEEYLARIRIDRNPADQNTFIGELKVYATVNEGALGEELLFDLDEIAWDGHSLSFQRGGEGFWQVFEGAVEGRKLAGTFTQSGTPQVFVWSAVRAEILGRGLATPTEDMLPGWRERTRHRLALLKMDGNPAPTGLSVHTLQKDLPPQPDSQMPADRDDNPAAWPQAYTLDELEFLIDLPDRHTGGTITRHAHGYLARPNNTSTAKKPLALVLNGHAGSAHKMMDPDSQYWYGDAFARRGYIVLALDVSHRLYGDDPGNGNVAHPPIASPGYSTDWEEDGERTWTAMRAIDFLLDLPDANPSHLVVAGLSMGGEVASLVAAMDPRVHTLVTAGYSTDFNVMAWGDNHPCWEWEHADIREYIDLSDYFSLVSPRRLVAQTGQFDYLFSLREPPFSSDKQIIRRTLRAWPNASRPVHHIHSKGHAFRVGDVSVNGSPATGITTTHVQSPIAPWHLSWQIDASTDVVAPDLFTLIGFTTEQLFADGFDPS
jgi:hypothetical protein